MSDSQLNFLLRVLQAVSESNGDAEAIYPLLQANLDKLDMNFAEALRSWATATLPNLEIEDVQNIVTNIFTFSNLIQEFPLGNRADNLEIAITGYDIALTVFTQQGFPDEWVTTQNNLGAAYGNRIRGKKAENLEQAIQYFQAVLTVWTQQRFPDKWVTTQYNLGNAYLERIRGEKAENLEQAIQYFQAALTVWTQQRFSYEWATTLNNLGNAYLDRIRGKKAENLEQAIQYFQATLTVWTQQGFPNQWATTLNNLGNAYLERSRREKVDNLEQAIQYFQAAVTVWTQQDFPNQWATTQNNLGATYSNRIRGEKVDNLEQAIQYFQAALTVRTQQDFRDEWATTQYNLGNAYLERIRGEKVDNLEQAIQYFQATLTVRTQQDFPQNYAETASNLGLVYIEARRWEDAYNTFQSAIDTVEFLRGEIVSGEEVKQKLAEEWNQLYLKMVEVCLQLKYYDQAMEYIERSKTRNLVELLAEVGRSLKLQQLGQKIEEEKRRLEVTKNSEPTSLNQLRQQREQIIPLQPIDFAEIQELVDDHTAIVQWYIFNDCFRAFIITRNSQDLPIWKSSPQDLQDLVEWSNEYLDYDTDKNKWRYQLTSQLARLADILHIKDILELVPVTCQALILIPHRYLHLLPLHALPLSGNGENYLLDKFPDGVKYAPSCQLLKFTKKQDNHCLGGLFAISDPNENLTYTNIEVSTIARHFQPVTVLKKSEATKQAVLAAQSLPSAQWVHFSCHGYFDVNSPLNSALGLAECYNSTSGADAGSKRSYRPLRSGDVLDLEKCLTLADIFKLKLPECRLVTLSACETGLTNPTSISDEYIGLPSGFLIAGSASIVSSLWSVDDFSTALLMIQFYQNLLSLPPAKALNKAQGWLRNATQQELLAWTQKQDMDEQDKRTIENHLQTWYKADEKPFHKPEHWAGFCGIGQ